MIFGQIVKRSEEPYIIFLVSYAYFCCCDCSKVVGWRGLYRHSDCSVSVAPLLTTSRAIPVLKARRGHVVGCLTVRMFTVDVCTVRLDERARAASLSEGGLDRIRGPGPVRILHRQRTPTRFRGHPLAGTKRLSSRTKRINILKTKIIANICHRFKRREIHSTFRGLRIVNILRCKPNNIIKHTNRL